MPAGRPTDYEPEYCKQLMEHMQDGYSYESFAGKVAVSFKTLYNWEKAHPEFLQSKEIGRAMQLMYWEDKVKDSLPAGIANASVLTLAMRNICKWRMKDPEEKPPKDEADKPVLNINKKYET